MTRRGMPLLTEREREVVSLVVAGLKNKAIAERLAIAERTVKNHLQSIFHKLAITSRLQLAMYAIQNRVGRAN